MYTTQQHYSFGNKIHSATFILGHTTSKVNLVNISPRNGDGADWLCIWKVWGVWDSGIIGTDSLGFWEAGEGMASLLMLILQPMSLFSVWTSNCSIPSWLALASVTKTA
ncbi:hypothetical protein F5141DRAFT_1067934 [Pisolithus sp. B1]|nr:hypothetical protein F5141DRAFT_1067934 [Pisolithus sp. B1]